MSELSPPPRSQPDWLALTESPIPVNAAIDWVSDPGCGAVVLFSGVVRDHAEGRPGVTALEYEAYEEQVGPRLAAIAGEARRRWPSLARLVAIHRVGALQVGEVAVVVVVATEHRQEAFESASFLIDTIKSTIPIWKLETWQSGHSWSEACHPVESPGDTSQREVGGRAAAGTRPEDHAARADVAAGAGTA